MAATDQKGTSGVQKNCWMSAVCYVSINHLPKVLNPMLRNTLVVACLVSGMLYAQNTMPANSNAQNKSTSSEVTSAKPGTTKSSRYHPDRFAGRAGTYYRMVWGIEGLSVKRAESGEMIRFTYQVVDAEKAKSLNDMKLEPSLIDEQAHVKLVVPQMDKVGKLRQSNVPQAGKTYWMLFSNKGGHVKRGDRVSVVIGKFRAEDLVVD